MIVQSKASIISLAGNPVYTNVFRGTRLYDGYVYDYATIYRTQPNVRTCVDFLARNVAQLGLHVFRRLPDNNRERLRDHPIAELLTKPLPKMFKVTRYRLICDMMSDLGIFYNAYLLKIKQDGGIVGLLRVPPEIVEVRGNLVPSEYQVYMSDEIKHFDPEDVIHLHGYNPDSAISGLSPLETLRRILAEEHAMGEYRENFWQNAARMNGIIERPADAPDWSDNARQRFKAEFEDLYSGVDASGKTAVLEEGMTWKQSSFNAQESEYLAGRKLTREECARAYHIPPPLVGILDHATFSNIREQHKSLYTDTLGPWLAQIEQDLECQLLPDFEDVENVYLEFNIQEKLQGDFQEQANSLQSAVGRPWMTANEARAIMNLPRIDNGDALVTPLNVMVGGLASPRDTGPKALTKGWSLLLPEKRERYEAEWQKTLTRTLTRQQAAIMSKVKMAPDINALWDYERWNTECAEDFYDLGLTTVLAWAQGAADYLDFKLDEDHYQVWARKNAQLFAERFNQSTMNDLREALAGEDILKAVGELFGYAIAVRAVALAISQVTSLSNYGTWSVARDGGVRFKTWMLGGGGNHRHSHMLVAGETVGVRERFSNGLRYPGDYQGSAEETVNCGCYLEYRR